MKQSRPPGELSIDVGLVRALLEEQHPDLAHLSLLDVGEGWDNRLFRLDDDLAVRLPRRALSSVLIEHEQRWLPELSRRLPLPIPTPRRIGTPSGQFPWSWSITPWFQGETALRHPPQDPEAAAVALGQFLRALHHPAPADAPHNPWRSVALPQRAASFLEHLQLLEGSADQQSALSLWKHAVSAPPWPGPPVWIHGDLHPGNLVIAGGRLRAVVDFGDLCAGDPATDLSVAWMLLPASSRSMFRAAARGDLATTDDDTWTRARGWALLLGLVFLAHSIDDPAVGSLGRRTIDAILNDCE
jgi:aminoglycoside phosphotransferase (APT) family kinase protein